MKAYSLDEAKNILIGERGAEKREEYEKELEIALEMAAIADKIKNIRKEKNLTQNELGEKIGMKKSQISKIENGYASVTIGTLKKVFNALDTNIIIKLEISQAI